MNTGLPEQRLIVFSDLDGTLLDHDTYEWSAAQPALEQLTFNNIPLILVSSKTFAELDGYRQQMRLEFPVVAENGAAIHLFGNEFPDDLVADGAVSRSELQAAYTDIKAAGGFNCEAFFELGVEGIVAETGLSPAQATLANERHATEPVRWRDSDERAAEFAAAAAGRGLHCVRGGRFLHLMGRNTKEKAVQQLIDAWADRHAGDDRCCRDHPG